MHRRSFIQCGAALTLATCIQSSSRAATPALDVLAEIKALRIPTGPYAGAYEIAPNGKINWYFSSLGLLPLVQAMSPADREALIRPYLDLYLRSVTPQYTINDVDFPAGRADRNRVQLVLSDSDDSYAATLLSLAARYFRASNNTAWWSQNKQQLKEIARRNIVLSIKPNGLTSVFQPPRSQSNNIGYLMDNCEAYRGLRDFAKALRQGGADAADADSFDHFATIIGNAIAGLYKPGAAAFLVGDPYRTPENSFYPGTTCQVFPQAFGVAEAAPGFDGAWNHLARYSPGWETGKYDAFPWMVLGFAAALRGRKALAKAQMHMLEERFASQRAVVTINELGFYQRISNVLAGTPDV